MKTKPRCDHYLKVREARAFNAAVDAVLGAGLDRQRRRKIVRALANSAPDFSGMSEAARIYAAWLQAQQLEGGIKVFRPASTLVLDGQVPDFAVVSPSNEMEIHFVADEGDEARVESVRSVRRGWPFFRYVVAVVAGDGKISHRSI